MTTKPIRLRHERKHQISLPEDLVLAGRLRKLFVHDPYAGADGVYRVTSLYFDTPYDAALREKLDGVDRREKFRLRYYGTDTSFLRLEKKIKAGGLCGKRSARLTPEEAGRLLAGEYDFLLKKEEPLLTELYSKLRGPWPGPAHGGVLRPGGVPLRSGPCPRHTGPEDPRRAEPVGFSPPGAHSDSGPGGAHRTGGQIRRVFARPGAHGRPGSGPAGRRLLQIRPVPAVRLIGRGRDKGRECP